MLDKPENSVNKASCIAQREEEFVNNFPDS